ncbi:hypothetical protein HY969_04145 [Candidatus Kaiserbacteria bacterium]|nr:hypothetical protein [Candidatus Kaiserbacteria bacterium]
MLEIATFLVGNVAAIGLFLYGLLRTSGFQALPRFAQISGRALVVTLSMFVYYLIFGALLIGAIIAIPLLLIPGVMPTGSDIKDMEGISLVLIALFFFVIVPVYVFNLAREAARFKMYVSSSINIYASAIILGVFFAGMWLASDFDGETIPIAIIVSLFMLMSFCSEKARKDSGRVSGVERWTLFAALCISLYTLFSGGFQSLNEIFMSGYIVGGVLLRLMVLFLPQHSTYSGKYRAQNWRSWRELRTRIAVFVMSALAISINYYFSFMPMITLVTSIVVVSDLVTMRGKYGFASVAFNWAELQNTRAPSAWSLVKLKSIR